MTPPYSNRLLMSGYFGSDLQLISKSYKDYNLVKFIKLILHEILVKTTR